jgi:hypothetical protein
MDFHVAGTEIHKQESVYMHNRLFCAFICLFLFGCTTAQEPSPAPETSVSPADTHALVQYQGDYFVSAGNCAFCHTGLLDEQGKDVSIDSHWRSTMMANAARDPYYRATVRSEVNAFPKPSGSHRAQVRHLSHCYGFYHCRGQRKAGFAVG